jgi:hypothetical protein
MLRGSRTLARDRIVAVALVTQPELELLGPSFRRAYPIDETPCFGELLSAIDDADRELWRQRDEEAAKEVAAPSAKPLSRGT